MGSAFGCCWRHPYEASIQFSISEWELEEHPVVFLARKWEAAGVTSQRVTELTYARIRRFIKTTKEHDVYCKVSGDLRGDDIEILIV
jgi:hypothetical protein